jgi:hypothetical protein
MHDIKCIFKHLIPKSTKHKRTSKQQEAETLALEAITIDKINCGEQQPEVDHQYKGAKQLDNDDEKF